MVKPRTLVGISEASRLLGVSEATLRQWTDDGSIKAFITPGGHRRYSPSEIKRFLVSRANLLRVKDLVGELERTADAHREIDISFLSAAEWYGGMPDASKKRLAALGRQILDLMMSFAAEPQKQSQVLEQAGLVGGEFGMLLAAEGVPLTDAVQAFIAHRDPVSGIIADVLRKKELAGADVLRVMPYLEQVMAAALVALVASHQKRAAA
ncbi:MAG: helix-turn-helix domain-containing protein [Dehalococcoidia bacterium]|nr:helix-turn-helix domain-containing protein [Dehalococcoidia bacterium]